MKSIYYCLCFSVLLFSSILTSQAQTISLSGKVIYDGQGLAAASVTVYRSGKVSTGTVTNHDGAFSISLSAQPDSLKVSMIGYSTRVIRNINWFQSSPFTIELLLQPLELSAIEVKPLSALEIVEQTIQHLPGSQLQEDFETVGFYREIIKDREHYFSVAEALFTVQFFPGKEDFKLKLDRGRTSEEVSYTKLFEDFHPGGGPQRAIKNCFLLDIPSFLRSKELRKYEFKRLPVTYYDDRRLYVISFDQKDDIKEALEKGKLFIDAEDFAVVKYEAASSPKGINYIKHLSGSDKFFAELLNIDLKRKAWKRTVDFIRTGDKYLLNHADMVFSITYKQPKKKLDLDLTISTEILINPQRTAINDPISKKEEWQRNNLVKNLPNAFDSAWWGSASIIQPTQSINEVVKAINEKNGTTAIHGQPTSWLKLNEAGLLSWQNGDSLALIPTQRSRWDNEHTGPLLYEIVTGDFTIETRLSVTTTNPGHAYPDKGFQQCGIMIRSANSEKENYLSIGLGTSGNKQTKLIINKTTNYKSRPKTEPAEPPELFLKMEKKGNMITAFKKLNEKDQWILIDSYSIEWGNDPMNTGLFGFAWFTGNGPGMYPDVKGIFTQTKIIKQTL